MGVLLLPNVDRLFYCLSLINGIYESPIIKNEVFLLLFHKFVISIAGKHQT